MIQPKISVIIPIYERRIYLESCLSALLKGSEMGMDALEVFVVDNSSPTPGLKEQVADLSEKLSGSAIRVDYRRWERNLGLYSSVNRAIQTLATGQYVHVLHEDDYVLPGFYYAILMAAGTCPEAGVISTAHRNLHSHDGSFNGPQSLANEPGILGSRLIARLLLANPIQVCSVVFRREIFEAIGPFRPDLPHTADWEWYLRAALVTDWYYVPTPLAVFRVHDQQDTQRNDRDGRTIHDVRRTYETFAELIPEHFETILRTGRVTAAQRATADAYAALQEGNVDLAAQILADALAMLRPRNINRSNGSPLS